MKKLVTYFSKLFSPSVGLQSKDVSHDCRLTVGSPSGFGSKSLLRLVSVTVLVFTISVGSAWSADPTLADLSFSTSNSVRIINEDFNGCSTSWSRTSTVANTTSQSDYGVFNYMYNNKTSNKYGIQNAVATTGFSSNCLSLYAGSGSPVQMFVSGKTFGNVGAWRLKTTKTSYNQFGIYKEKSNNAITHADTRVHIQNNKGTISISSGSSWTSVKTVTTDIIDICVIYNKSGSSTTYGNSISIANNTAHIYINGECVMNGSNPKAFSISSTDLTSSAVFKVLPQTTSGNYSYVDDIQVWNALPTAAASCGADPTVTAASNNGSITSTSIPVQCASGISNIGGAGCSLTSYGFVWAPSATTTTPTLSNSSHEVGTSIAASTAFNYSITGLTPNTEYVIRPYATNGNGTGYGDAYTVTTLQRYTISYNNNGGSGSMASSTKDHGVAFALPANAGTMTKTGYHIKQWRLNSAGGTAYPLSGSYTTDANATFYVDWEANTYTVNLNGNGATGAGSPSSVTATYNANTLSSAITNPTKTDYIFGGWNTKDDGTGLTVIDASGNLVASQSGYTDASKNWINDGGVTLYAKWTEHTYTNYRTQCCTDLGAIDGEATLTQGGNSVTISGWSDVANVGTYTVKLYKKNGASWDLVSGSTSGGSAGTQGTRTGITSGSKSVTYTGLVVESEYKFTIQAIAGSAAYCDGVETAVTEINSTDVSSTPFKFRYSIYIDNGSNSGWAHHYIEPTGNTDEGSVSITLGAHVDYYQFKIAGGFSGWWGQSGSSKIPANTQWTLNSDQNVRLETGAGGAYVFTIDYSGTTNPKVTVTFPSADQDADYKIYFDKSAVADWGSTLKYRIGNGSHNQNQNFTLVTGTDQFYVTTTPEYGSMDAWQIANNVAWDGSHSIYNYHNGDGYDITRATVYQDYAVNEDITIVPTSVHNTENSCQFWDVSKTSGMLTHTATITTPSHGTITISNTDQSLSATATTADLPHRTILTITATPATGYTCTSLTVNGAAFTSGSTHILAADATIAATFTAQTSTVTLDNNNATSGSQQTVTATYDATMPLVTTADGTPAVAALTRTGYTFNGWWDNTSGGNQYYTYSGSPKVIASARTWDKTGAQTLKAQWTVNQYTLTWDLQGGTVATAGTGAAAAATGTPSSSQDYGTALKAPVVTKTGYNFNVWSPSVASTMPAENTTYTASWTAQVYNITYKDQGDNAYSGNVTAGVPTGAPTTHTYGAATDLVDGVRSGYRFDGWFTTSACTGDPITSIGATAITANTTLYAKWTQVYTVTWSVNGDEWESGVVDGNTHVPGGSKVSALPTAPTSSDCDDSKVFVGWRATAIVGTSAGNPGSIFTTQAGSPTISANTTFYAVFADVSGGNSLDLTFPDDNSANNGLTSDQYTSEWTAKAGTFSFTINNFNNNNWGGSWKYIKCGRNGSASVAKITTGSDIDFRVDSVLVKLENITSSKVNSAKLQISSASTFVTTTDMDIPQSSGWQRLKIASPATDKYYRIVYDCASNSSNGFVSISEVVFKQNYDTANYVTTCSSCDANATYTNTTPTVSEIGCTGATLTMEDGLATVGADGCHVSDYGFVIGTSDNPAIGGDGVTKLQVGTSDPTIGEDFSYDATGLTKGIHYYIRAYAINRHGTAYSSSQSFYTNGVSSIAITTAPDRTGYIVGETFDAEGMVVTATMADGSTEHVTRDCSYSTSALTVGASQNFAINYSLCETDKSVNQVINVYTLTVTEGTNPGYGVASASANIISITGLSTHKTYTLTVTSDNADIVDNGNNTWKVLNPTGNVAVTVNYADAAQVKVYYRVDGVIVTGLTQDVYQSETTTLPTASELATAMTAQSMDLPDDAYPNFIGWSATQFSAQTADPSLVTGSPTINAETNYYAVYTNVNKKSILPTDFVAGYASNEGEKTIDGEKYQIHDICLQASKIQFKASPGYLYSKEALSYLKKIEITGLDLVVNACSDNAGTVDGAAITSVGTAPYTYTFPANKSYFKITGNGTTAQVSRIDIYYANATVYYMTDFCTRYTITGASTSGTAVTSGTLTCNYNSACEGKSVELEAEITSGYQFNGWTITGSTSGDITSTLLPGDNATSLTPSAFSMPDENITVAASITEKTVTGWTWKQVLPDATQIAIPATVELYIGQQARFELIGYIPSDVLEGKKGYDATYTNADLAQDNKASDYYVTRGKQEVANTTLTFTSTSNGSVVEEISIRVKALPSATFVDNVHNESFGAVTATIDDTDKRIAHTTKRTPTHASMDDPGSGNTCERAHLHLVGWIDGAWDAYEAYMNGTGDKPTESEIIGATGYFYLPNTDIDLEAKDGHTYYAVWAIME